MPLDIIYNRNNEANKRLAEEGYLHATNLTCRSTASQVTRTIRADEKHYGTWNTCNGMTFIVTTEGEVWIAYSDSPSKELVAELCPKGQSDVIFFGGGELFDPQGFLARHKDPYFGIDASGKYDHGCQWSPFSKL